jgi:hypothetical protein
MAERAHIRDRQYGGQHQQTGHIHLGLLSVNALALIVSIVGICFFLNRRKRKAPKSNRMAGITLSSRAPMPYPSGNGAADHEYERISMHAPEIGNVPELEDEPSAATAAMRSARFLAPVSTRSCGRDRCSARPVARFFAKCVLRVLSDVTDTKGKRAISHEPRC